MNRDLEDPARAYVHKKEPALKDDDMARFAPADNLYDAIRADVEPIGGVDLEPLPRDRDKEYPFNDLDWPPGDE